MSKDFSMCVLLDIYGGVISQKQYEVMDLYYNQDYSLAEISEHFGITRQGVRDSIKRAEQVIKECEEKLKLSEKFESNGTKIEKINNILEDILSLNNVKLKDESLESFVKKISETLGELQL